MTIRFGVSPIAWINDDMPELGGDTPVESVLRDIQDVGFAGVELGGKFPRDPDELRALLDRYGLALVGGWYSSNLLVRDAEAEIDALRGHLELLQALGSTVFVIAETSNAIHGDREPCRSRSRPILSDDEWKIFGERLTDGRRLHREPGPAACLSSSSRDGRRDGRGTRPLPWQSPAKQSA